MFAIIVTFQIDTARFSDFMPLMLANAKTSLAVEPGCRRFDVCTDPDRPGEVFLYELYENAEAFQAHLAADHFKRFDAAVADMVRSKDVRSYTQVAS